jgi:signal transduction histidine kinase
MSDVVETEANAIVRLTQIRSEYRVQKPTGVGLTPRLNRDWKSHLSELERLDIEYFSPTEKLIGEIVSTASNEAQVHIERRHRVNRLVNEVSAVLRKTLSDEIDRLIEASQNTQERVTDLTKILLQQMNNTIDQIEGEINKANLDKMSEDEITKFRAKLEKRLTDETDDYKGIIRQILTQLANIQWETDESGIPKLGGDWTAALEDEVLALRERSQSDLYLTQLGMAIEIINHEFESAIRSIRSNLQSMKNWADINPDFRKLYRDIRANFEHLDGYLTLFTPLHRRLYRTEVSISGADIAKFIEDLFGERMKRHNIDFKASPSFREKVIRGYPSTFYPVFVNLVDNAIYWLGDIPKSRKIRFDAKDKALLISNNGPEIPPRDRESIFERGFTRKPGGAGLGLYISRVVLNRDGYQLELDLSEPERGTTFRISLKEP